MTEATQVLLAILLSLPRFHADTETAVEREERLTTIARSIHEASERATCAGAYDAPECERLWPGSTKELETLLVTQGFMESRFAQRVHEGRCQVRIGECDGGRARSVWQLQASGLVPREAWVNLEGTSYERTRAAAWYAIQVLYRARNACGSIEGAISRYATGRSCRWTPAKKRVDFYRRLLARRIEG